MPAADSLRHYLTQLATELDQARSTMTPTVPGWPPDPNTQTVRSLTIRHNNIWQLLKGETL